MSTFQRVVVLYPRGLQTGGPEAVHQLVHRLRKEGADAFLLPSPDTVDVPAVADYAVYECPEIAQGTVRPTDLLVLPELYVGMVGYFNTSLHAIWWLSIDNSPAFFSFRGWLRGEQGPITPREGLRTVKRIGRRISLGRRLRRSVVEHLAQSAYAQARVKKAFGSTARILTDYTTAAPSTSAAQVARRTDPTGPLRVAFNPRKGARMAMRVRELSHDVEFVPLINIPREEISDVLAGCHVYLDTGHHPGKDRLPREAAMSGCVVLVNRRGSGAYRADVPLDAHYKFSTAGEASAALEAVRADLDGYRRGMSDYVASIADEPDRFTAEVRDCFGLN